MRIGIRVFCPKCNKVKAPRGRSVPPEIYSAYCTWDQCPSYYDHPKPGDLWCGESEDDFGYPISNDGTREES